MRSKLALAIAASASVLTVNAVAGQDLGPNIQKVKDGVYVYFGNARPNGVRDSNAGIVITQEGVLLVDTGNNPTDSRRILAAVKTLTPQPVRYVVLTEPHPDHYTGSFLFSPPAVVITHASGIEGMAKYRTSTDPARIERLRDASPEMRTALEGYRFIVPQREYRQKTTLNMGNTTIELLYLKNVHSEADTAVWLPKEGVLFAGAVISPDQFNAFRPFVTIPAIQAAIKTLKGLNPQFVIPGHGVRGIPGTVKILEQEEQFYAALLDRVGRMVKDGKSLDQITEALRLPDYDGRGSKDTLPPIIESAYKTVKGLPHRAFDVEEPCHYSAPPCRSQSR